jgi:hypothetical protein
MKNVYYLISIILLAGCSVLNKGCSCKHKYFEVDTQILEEKIYDPTATKYEALQQSTVLYLDHSTCVIDARQNLKSVFNALRPQLGQYSDTLILIKGDDFENVPLNRSDNKVFQVLQTIQQDIPHADILKAVEQICNDNQQAILITDCEFFRDGLVHDQDPYLSEPFKNWIKKGHSIYIVVEPYHENRSPKKRFYYFFTNDRMQAPISHNMMNEIQPFLNDGSCKLFVLTNTDILVQREKNNMVDNNLTFTVEDKTNFEFVEISDSWEAIREYVMKLDEYGELITGEIPVPLIKNLIFSNGKNYIIKDVRIKATNITAQYLALEDSTITTEAIDMSEGFKLDKDSMKVNKLNVLLTDKVFQYLTDEYGGNLIRLDFEITEVSLQNYEAEMFLWPSLNNNETAICVSKSIENVLHDVEILPTSKDRKVIHTVFIKTEAYE